MNIAEQVDNAARFVTAAFDMAWAERAIDISEAALTCWTALIMCPETVQPDDNAILYDFIESAPDNQVRFAAGLQSALTGAVMPALAGDLMLIADRRVSYAGNNRLRADLEIFDFVDIELVADGVRTARVPLMALETLDALIFLPDGAKRCPCCGRLFYNPRKNAVYCGEKCRYRQNYENRKGGL